MRAVVYGASANRRCWWDNRAAARMGYAPQDDAEAWADALLARDPPEPGGDLALRCQGGELVETS